MEQGSSPNTLLQSTLFSAEGGLSSLAKPRDASESLSEQPRVTSPDSLAKASRAADADIGGGVGHPLVRPARGSATGQAWITLSLGRQQVIGNCDPSTTLATKTPLSCTCAGSVAGSLLSHFSRKDGGVFFSPPLESGLAPGLARGYRREPA